MATNQIQRFGQKSCLVEDCSSNISEIAIKAFHFPHLISLETSEEIFIFIFAKFSLSVAKATNQIQLFEQEDYSRNISKTFVKISAVR